jgi:hypothetical protein
VRRPILRLVAGGPTRARANHGLFAKQRQFLATTTGLPIICMVFVFLLEFFVFLLEIVAGNFY